MTGRLRGKRALVYGGGTGLGFACAAAMAEEGATIFLSGRRREKLAAAIERLPKGAKAGFEPGDATLEADVQRVTQDLAHSLEELVRRAPEQWHLMQPNWPSDHDALGLERPEWAEDAEPGPAGAGVP